MKNMKILTLLYIFLFIKYRTDKQERAIVAVIVW
jgi:hypothetical protein